MSVVLYLISIESGCWEYRHKQEMFPPVLIMTVCMFQNHNKEPMYQLADTELLLVV